MLDSYCTGVEEDEDNDQPEPPLLFTHPSNPELELFQGQHQTWKHEKIKGTVSVISSNLPFKKGHAQGCLLRLDTLDTLHCTLIGFFIFVTEYPHMT